MKVPRLNMRGDRAHEKRRPSGKTGAFGSEISAWQHYSPNLRSQGLAGGASAAAVPGVGFVFRCIP